MAAVGEIACWWAVLVVVWLATLNALSVEEVVTAAILALPCAWAARAARRAAGEHWRPPAGALRWLLALPWAVLHDAVAALLLAVRGRPEGEFVELSLGDDGSDRRRAAREALATATLSATAGSVVVEATDRHDALLVHTLSIGETAVNREVRGCG
jgi:multisubunit Na+/H+ antiporter MnhE subunit